MGSFSHQNVVAGLFGAMRGNGIHTPKKHIFNGKVIYVYIYMIYSPLDLGVDLGALYQVQAIDSSLCIPFLLWDSQKKSRAAALGTEGAASLPSHWIAGAGLVAWCSWTRCWKIRLDQEELPMGRSLERSLVMSWRRHWRERSRSIIWVPTHRFFFRLILSKRTSWSTPGWHVRDP